MKYTSTEIKALFTTLLVVLLLLATSCSSIKEEKENKLMMTPAMVTPLIQDSVSHKYKALPNRIIHLNDSQMAVINQGDTIQTSILSPTYVIVKIAQEKIEIKN